VQRFLSPTLHRLSLGTIAWGAVRIVAPAILLLCGCGQPPPEGSRTSDVITLRRGFSGQPGSLDPAAAADTFSTDLLLDLYEGLTTDSAAGDVTAGVAASWSLDPSGTEYTFQIRPDARWSNGQPVRAQDFVIAWRRVIDPKEGSPVADDLRLVLHAPAIIAGKAPPSDLGVFASSDQVLVVKLEQPAPFFLHILAHPSTFPIYSEASARTHLPNAWISNGPYVLSSWQPSTAIEFKRNLAYWDRAHVQIPRVIYQFASDETAQYTRYRAGELDITDSVPASAMPTLREEHSTELVIAPYLGTVYYAINLTNRSLSADVRQALAMAIDRKRLVDSLGFGQVGAYSFVPPGTSDYTPQTWPWKDLSDADRVAEAKRLYAKAGFSAKSPLHLRLLIHSNEAIRRTAILTSAMWKEILGMSVELVEEEYRVFLDSRHDKSRWDVARLAWVADYNDASNFLDTLRVHSPNNDPGYANPSFDLRADQAAATIDVHTRRQKLENAERVMLSDYPIIPLYYYVSKRLVKSYVLGVKPSPLNHVPSKTLLIRAD